MSLHQSGEDYLEAILVLREKNGVVHSIDVAQHLGYSKPSVSRAVSLLKGEGYLTMEKDGRLELTGTGVEVANQILERHRFLKQWLINLGVSAETAEEDACKIEHNISDETFQCLKRHTENMGALLGRELK
jgi:Mn-dependent DtxR family transcriptional regulator